MHICLQGVRVGVGMRVMLICSVPLACGPTRGMFGAVVSQDLESVLLSLKALLSTLSDKANRLSTNDTTVASYAIRQGELTCGALHYPPFEAVAP